MAYESGWVIEHEKSPGHAPAYFTGDGWSVNNLEALRFARKQDGEKIRASMGPNTHRVADHGWID